MRESLALLLLSAALVGCALQPLLDQRDDGSCTWVSEPSGTLRATALPGDRPPPSRGAPVKGLLDRQFSSFVFRILDDGGSALLARARLRAEAAEGMEVSDCFFHLPAETEERIAGILARTASRSEREPILAASGWDVGGHAAASIDRSW